MRYIKLVSDKRGRTVEERRGNLLFMPQPGKRGARRRARRVKCQVLKFAPLGTV
jgi:hypothetical protein